MQILEVMRRMNSETEVTFLLSAYAETLQQYDIGHNLPHGVASLPVRGVDDVRNRFEALLEVELGGAPALADGRAHAIVREAAEIFGVALARMQTLHVKKQDVLPRPVELAF